MPCQCEPAIFFVILSNSEGSCTLLKSTARFFGLGELGLRMTIGKPKRQCSCGKLGYLRKTQAMLKSCASKNFLAKSATTLGS